MDTCTTREAARRLGVSLRTVQLWTESGVLDAWKTAGGHRRVLLTAVERLIAQRLPAARAESRVEAPKVLVVEDEPTLLKLYRMNIESFPFPLTLETAGNGYEGLIRIGEMRPDVLITDLMMPGIDGFRMLRTLASRHDFARMRVIVVSGLHARDVEERGGLPEGVVLLGKPIPFDRLEKLIAEYARLSRPMESAA